MRTIAASSALLRGASGLVNQAGNFVSGAYHSLPSAGKGPLVGESRQEGPGPDYHRLPIGNRRSLVVEHYQSIAQRDVLVVLGSSAGRSVSSTDTSNPRMACSLALSARSTIAAGYLRSQRSGYRASVGPGCALPRPLPDRGTWLGGGFGRPDSLGHRGARDEIDDPIRP